MVTAEEVQEDHQEVVMEVEEEAQVDHLEAMEVALQALQVLMVVMDLSFPLEDIMRLESLVLNQTTLMHMFNIFEDAAKIIFTTIFTFQITHIIIKEESMNECYKNYNKKFLWQS